MFAQLRKMRNQLLRVHSRAAEGSVVALPSSAGVIDVRLFCASQWLSRAPEDPADQVKTSSLLCDIPEIFHPRDKIFSAFALR